MADRLEKTMTTRLPANARRAGSTLARKAKGHLLYAFPVDCGGVVEIRSHKIPECVPGAVLVTDTRFRGECYIRDARPLGGLSSTVVFDFVTQPKSKHGKEAQKQSAIAHICERFNAKVVETRGDRVTFRITADGRLKLMASKWWVMFHDA